MHKTLLYQKLKNKSVRCLTCQRKCVINESQWGFCKTRVNKNGTLYSTIYGVVSSINLDPIEKKPVYHYKPGSYCLSLGTYGCNFRCKFCQNYEISYADVVSLNIDSEKLLSPKDAVEMAKKSGADGIAFTYNEPAIWLEYCLDVFKLAHSLQQTANSTPLTANGIKQKAISGKPSAALYTCWVTNGYATTQAIDVIAPYLDIYRVDLKSFDDNFYQKLIGIPKAKDIFDTTKYVHDKYPKIHIECVTNIIPTWNDSEDNLRKIAGWITKNLGPQTPWHVTRFFPHAQMLDIPPTPIETLKQAEKIGREEGLKFVHIGNI